MYVCMLENFLFKKKLTLYKVNLLAPLMIRWHIKSTLVKVDKNCPVSWTFSLCQIYIYFFNWTISFNVYIYYKIIIYYILYL